MNAGVPGFDAMNAEEGALFVGQMECGIGAFCADGLSTPCPGGSFGKISHQSSRPAACVSCLRGSYVAEQGTANTPAGSPCSPCPPGSFASTEGHSSCSACPANHFGVISAANSSDACKACPSGTFAWAGNSQSSCIPLGAFDTQTFFGSTLLFEHFVPFNSGNLGDAALINLNFALCIPVALLCTLPLLLFALSVFAPAIRNHCTMRVLRQMDMSTEKSTLSVDRKELVRLTTPLGGACTSAAIGVFLCLVLVMTTQYAYSNTNVQQMNLLVSLFEQRKFAILTPFDVRLQGGDGTLQMINAALGHGLSSAETIAAAAAATTVHNASAPAAPFAGLSSGLLITVATMGRHCGTHAMASSIANNANFRNWSSFNALTQGATHFFSCDLCVVDGLSFLAVELDASCASFVVTAVAVGAWGTHSLASFEVANVSMLAATLEVALEVAQDFEQGTFDADGYVAGGRSSRGLFLTSLTNITSLAHNASSTATTLLLRLPNAPQYSLVQYFPVLTLIQLLSSLSGLLSTLSLGTVALGLLALSKRKSKLLIATEWTARRPRMLSSMHAMHDRVGEPSQSMPAATAADGAPTRVRSAELRTAQAEARAEQRAAQAEARADLAERRLAAVEYALALRNN